MAVEPRILNPVNVTFEQIIEASTKFDHIRREPVNYIKRNEKFSLLAQIKWFSNESGSVLEIDQSGRNEQQSGYMILLNKDL